ncbi:hypothetical protein D3C76_1383270 [compost metagenome]
MACLHFKSCARTVSGDHWQVRQLARLGLANPYLANEAVALAGNGADQTLYFTRVTNRPAHGVNVTGNSGLGNDAAIPHLLEQVILANDMVAVTKQMQQEIENLWPYINHIATNSQFPALLVENVVFKHE